MTEQELQTLYKSEEWKNASKEKRAAFQSKLRATKRIEKELKKKKPIYQLSPAKRLPLTKKQKRRQKLAEIKKTKALQIAPKFVSGIDVTTVEFLSTYEWRKVRMMALKKHGARCQCCGASAATGAVIHVDHIKPRKLFPQLALDVDNLQVLCHECNHGKGNWDTTDWRPKEDMIDKEMMDHIRSIQQE